MPDMVGTVVHALISFYSNPSTIYDFLLETDKVSVPVQTTSSSFANSEDVKKEGLTRMSETQKIFSTVLSELFMSSQLRKLSQGMAERLHGALQPVIQEGRTQNYGFWVFYSLFP